MEDQTTEINDCTQGTEQQEAIHEEHPHEEHPHEEHPHEEHPHEDHIHTEHHHHSSHSEHHHHSRHKHHRHRRHKHSSSKKKNPVLRFWKKNRSVIINIASCTVSVVLLLLLALSIDSKKQEDIRGHYTDITKSTVKVETSLYYGKIPLVHEAVLQYMDPSNTQTATKFYQDFDGHKFPLNTGKTVSFQYEVTGLPTGTQVKSAVLELSEHEDYRDPEIYNLNLDDTTLELDFLKTGTKYYYRVLLELNNANTIGTTGTFETQASPRILSIDGITNVRDLGGWQVADGRTIKQGLIYRGTELDGAVEADYCLTERGLQQMTEELGIRFDMDLRAKGPNHLDALGTDVTHKYYAVAMYYAILDNQEQLRELFSDLAEPENYPVYIHCTYGRDRTGSVCYLLEALLGVSDSDLEREYSLTAFTNSYINLPELNALIERISMFSGNTTQEKVEGYLLSIGVTPQQIASIREILLTPNANS